MLNTHDKFTITIGGKEFNYTVERADHLDVYYVVQRSGSTSVLRQWPVVRSEVWEGHVVLQCDYPDHLLARTLEGLEVMLERVKVLVDQRKLTPKVDEVINKYGFGCQQNSVRRLCSILTRGS